MTPTTDLQKLPTVDTTSQRFKDAVAAYLAAMHGAQGEILPPLYYAIKAWERAKIAPDLAARVIELEAENKRLRDAVKVALNGFGRLVDFTETTEFDHEIAILERALKGGEI